MHGPFVSLFASRGAAPRPARRAHPAPDLSRPARRPIAPSPALPLGIVAALRQSPHLPPRLGEALALACDEQRGIRTVDRLAAAAGCDRRTLWTHWRQALGLDAELRLQDFVHWLLVLRATHRKAAGVSWAGAAHEVGIHPHTLSRLARQLTGCSLRDLEAEGHAALALRFEAEVLSVVLRTAADAAPAG
jgi:hypothetical protein